METITLYLIEKTEERFRKLLFITENVEVLPPHMQEVEFETIKLTGKLEIEGPVWDSENNEFISSDEAMFLENPEQYKQTKLDEFSAMSLQLKDDLIPQYKIENALCGVDGYDGKKEMYAATFNAFRAEYYRLKDLVDNATTKKEIDNIVIGFPVKLVE